MKTETNIHELAIRYFEGHISKTEEKLLFSYIERAEENRLRFRQWEKEWKVTNEGDEQTMHEWQRLQRRLRTQEAIMPMLPCRYFSFWRRVAAVAAIVVLTAGATLGIWNIASLSSTEDYFVFEAPYGEKSKMTLADGTVVWLNAGSVLKYSDKFNERNRKVILSGEAYFEVTKKEKAKFTVQTCGYDVVVKGTKFDVSAYPEDSVVTTALMEGIVEIRHGRVQKERQTHKQHHKQKNGCHIALHEPPPFCKHASFSHLGMPGGGIARTARQGFHQNMGMFNELRERN